ncbi:hypothetical protein CLAIMM_11123 [Cladophialophora immunda]|nr:hypothetical protein CLAIMM_11123 [Cladophialophora immunda]
MTATSAGPDCAKITFLANRCTPRSLDGATRAEYLLEGLNSRPRTHPGRGQTTQREQDRRNSVVPALAKTTHVSRPALIMTSGNTGIWVEALARQCSSTLDGPGHVHDGGDTVGEVETEKAADEIGDGGEIGDGNIPLLRADRRQSAELLTNFQIDRLHADIEIQEDSKKTGHQGQDVADKLQTV